MGLASASTKTFLVPFPFSLWHVIGYVAEALPSPPLTRNPVALAFGLNPANGLRTGLLLRPGGEFAFVIVSAASGEHLLAPDVAGMRSTRVWRSDEPLPAHLIIHPLNISRISAF
jgi:Kef-type K+ transport system membrane component KefB